MLDQSAPHGVWIGTSLRFIGARDEQQPCPGRSPCIPLEMREGPRSTLHDWPDRRVAAEASSGRLGDPRIDVDLHRRGQRARRRRARRRAGGALARRDPLRLPELEEPPPRRPCDLELATPVGGEQVVSGLAHASCGDVGTAERLVDADDLSRRARLRVTRSSSRTRSDTAFICRSVASISLRAWAPRRPAPPRSPRAGRRTPGASRRLEPSFRRRTATEPQQCCKDDASHTEDLHLIRCAATRDRSALHAFRAHSRGPRAAPAAARHPASGG